MPFINAPSLLILGSPWQEYTLSVQVDEKQKGAEKQEQNVSLPDQSVYGRKCCGGWGDFFKVHVKPRTQSSSAACVRVCVCVCVCL